MINEFKDKYFFLSNFYPASVTVDNITYPTSEHAFAAEKTLDMEKRKEIASLPTPGQAKRAGRNLVLRENWEDIKFQAMLVVVKFKFNQHPDLKQKLIDTGDEELIEGNNWGDKVWGVDINTGEGDNWLGKILMFWRIKFVHEMS